MAGAVTPIAMRVNPIGTTLPMDISEPSRLRLKLRGGPTPLEAVLLDDCGGALVVERRVRVDPVALRIYVEREHLRDVGPFQQKLLSRNQVRDQLEFGLVQLKQFGVS